MELDTYFLSCIQHLTLPNFIKTKRTLQSVVVDMLWEVSDFLFELLTVMKWENPPGYFSVDFTLSTF